jgi:class 3 adenylate cyclase
MLATVLFTDIVGSTRRAAEIGDHAWHALLDAHEGAAARLVERHRGRLVKSTGDGLLATFDGPSRAIDCALALQEDGRRAGIQLRAGLHTGEVELRGDDIGGIAVHIASRIQSLAAPDQVLVSRTVNDLVAGSDIHFEEPVERELKGIPGRWKLFSVADPSRTASA